VFPPELVSPLSFELARTPEAVAVSAEGQGVCSAPTAKTNLWGGGGSSYKDSIAKSATGKNTPCDTSIEVADRPSQSEKNTGCVSWAIDLCPGPAGPAPA